jgi:hypothetical protein
MLLLAKEIITDEVWTQRIGAPVDKRWCVMGGGTG